MRADKSFAVQLDFVSYFSRLLQLAIGRPFLLSSRGPMTQGMGALFYSGAPCMWTAALLFYFGAKPPSKTSWLRAWNLQMKFYNELKVQGI